MEGAGSLGTDPIGEYLVERSLLPVPSRASIVMMTDLFIRARQVGYEMSSVPSTRPWEPTGSSGLKPRGCCQSGRCSPWGLCKERLIRVRSRSRPSFSPACGMVPTVLKP